MLFFSHVTAERAPLLFAIIKIFGLKTTQKLLNFNFWNSHRHKTQIIFAPNNKFNIQLGHISVWNITIHRKLINIEFSRNSKAKHWRLLPAKRKCICDCREPFIRLLWRKNLILKSLIMTVKNFYIHKNSSFRRSLTDYISLTIKALDMKFLLNLDTMVKIVVIVFEDKNFIRNAMAGISKVKYLCFFGVFWSYLLIYKT